MKSNAELFNTGTWAGGIWREDTISARGDKCHRQHRRGISAWRKFGEGEAARTVEQL